MTTAANSSSVKPKAELEGVIKSPLRYITLNSRRRMPTLAFGTSTDQDPAEVEQAVLDAIDAGYRHIETSFSDGNEKAVGIAIAKAIREKKVKRDQLFITTKLPNNGHRREMVPYFMKRSLQRLHLTYVDLYLIEFPTAGLYKNDDDCFPDEPDMECDIGLTWQGMEDVHAAGLSHSIGVCNFTNVQLALLFDVGRMKPAVLQVECHAYLSQKELYEYCRRHRIVVMANSPLANASGSSSAAAIPDRRTVVTPLSEHPIIVRIAEEVEKSPAQVCLRWLLQRRMAVIERCLSHQRMIENFSVYEFSLSQTQMAAIYEINKNLRFFTYDDIQNIVQHPNYPFKLNSIKK